MEDGTMKENGGAGEDDDEKDEDEDEEGGESEYADLNSHSQWS
jgi:hypothetical protein